jgi:hypothetical protein
MATRKKRPARRAAKKRPGRKRSAAKSATPQRPSSATPRRATSKSTTVRRKERKVEEAKHRLIDAEKELAVELRKETVSAPMTPLIRGTCSTATLRYQNKPQIRKPFAAGVQACVSPGQKLGGSAAYRDCNAPGPSRRK